MAIEKLVWNDSMMASAVILIVTFLGIFTATQHGLHRTKFAMLGAGAMVFAGQIYGFYSPSLAITPLVVGKRYAGGGDDADDILRYSMVVF
ncbi:MAG: hypothetical protein ACU833_06460 [Gammaproteobacteria bacterium]